jgi:hypothetical protein
MGLFFSKSESPSPSPQVVSKPTSNAVDPSLVNYLQQYYVSRDDLNRMSLPNGSDYVLRSKFDNYQKNIETTLNGLRESVYTKDQIDDKYQKLGASFYQQLGQIQSSPTALYYLNPDIGATRISPKMAVSNSIQCIGPNSELVILYGPPSTLDTIMPLNGNQLRELIRTQPEMLIPYSYIIREMLGINPKIERVSTLALDTRGRPVAEYTLVDPTSAEYKDMLSILREKYYGYLLKAC